MSFPMNWRVQWCRNHGPLPQLGSYVMGAVITGDTDHDQVVAHTAARKLTDVSIRRDKPVTFGVIGPDMSAAEARERIEYSADAVETALTMLTTLPDTTER